MFSTTINSNDTLQKYYNYEVLDDKQAEIAELKQQAVERERKSQQKKAEREERKKAIVYARKEKRRKKEETRNQKEEIFALKHPVIAKMLSFLSFVSFEEVMRFIIVLFNVLLMVFCVKILMIILPLVIKFSCSI